MGESSVLPRVSTILGDLGFNNGHGSLYHLARGQALHRAIQLDLQGDLVEDSIHPDIKAGFAAWRSFRERIPVSMVSAECELSDPTWRFCGHPDLVASVGPVTTLFDYKFTESVDLFYASHQVAAYRHLWDLTRPDLPIAAMQILQLTPRGHFRLHHIWPSEWTTLTHTVLAAVRVWHALGDRRQRR